MAELESEIDQTERALERVKLRANSDTIQAEADLKSKEAEFAQQKVKLEKYGDQIKKAKIHASVAASIATRCSITSRTVMSRGTCRSSKGSRNCAPDIARCSQTDD